MWCSDCNTDFEDVQGSVIQVCPHCTRARKAGKNSGDWQRRRVPKLQPIDVAASRAAAAIKRPKLKQYRSSGQRNPGQTESKASATSPVPTDLNWSRRPTAHLVAFGLFVFLVGQALQIWAFFSEQFFIWSLAKLVSIIGITVAFGAAFVSLQRFDRRLRELARQVGRSQSAATPKRRAIRQRFAGKRS